MNKTQQKESVVQHYHHRDIENTFARSVSINGSVYSISLCSDDPGENMDYLTKKAMEILKQLIQEGK